jgi:CPA2 family monovalent cation:H+ antiporter-2
VFPEGLETSLTFAAQLLVLLEVPAEEVERVMNEIRAEDYAQLRLFFHATDDRESSSSDYQELRRSILVRENDAAVGRTPRELGLDRPPPRLERIMRGGLKVPGEQLDARLRSGDILVLTGSPEEIEGFERRLRGG